MAAMIACRGLAGLLIVAVLLQLRPASCGSSRIINVEYVIDAQTNKRVGYILTRLHPIERSDEEGAQGGFVPMVINQTSQPIEITNQTIVVERNTVTEEASATDLAELENSSASSSNESLPYETVFAGEYTYNFSDLSENGDQHQNLDEETAPDSHYKTITIYKKVPAPYPVEKPVHYPVIKKVPYAVEVPIPEPFPVEKPVPYPVKVLIKVPVKIPQPVPIVNRVFYPSYVPVERPVPHRVYIPKPYPVEKTVHYEVKVPVPQPYAVEKPVPIAVKVPIRVPQPYPVEKKVHVPVHVEEDKPVPVPVIKPYPVHITKRIPYTVEKYVPVPVRVFVERPVQVPVEKLVPVKIQVPVEVPYPVEVDYHHHPLAHQDKKDENLNEIEGSTLAPVSPPQVHEDEPE